MKTILFSLATLLFLSSCSKDEICECNLYQLTFDSEGQIEQTLVETKSGSCTEEDIANFVIAEDVNCY